MNADKNKQDGSFPEADEVYKAAAPRQSAARKRVSPRPAWLAERPEVRVSKDLAAFFEFFTPLHFCVAHPRDELEALRRCRACAGRNDSSVKRPAAISRRGALTVFRVKAVIRLRNRFGDLFDASVLLYAGGSDLAGRSF